MCLCVLRVLHWEFVWQTGHQSSTFVFKVFKGDTYALLYCDTHKKPFLSLHLLTYISGLTVWQRKQRAKGASRAFLSKCNPFTYRTIRIFFVLICDVIYLHLRYLLVLCCVNLDSIPSHYTLNKSLFSLSQLHFIVQCDWLVFVLVSVV